MGTNLSKIVKSIKKQSKLVKAVNCDGGITATQSFNADCVIDVGSDGLVRHQYKRGMEAEIVLNIGGRGHWQIASTHDDGYGSGSLTVEGKDVVDFDGAFDLPSRIKDMLKELGFKITW
jgi:hypothetical protein